MKNRCTKETGVIEPAPVPIQPGTWQQLRHARYQHHGGKFCKVESCTHVQSCSDDEMFVEHTVLQAVEIVISLCELVVRIVEWVSFVTKHGTADDVQSGLAYFFNSCVNFRPSRQNEITHSNRRQVFPFPPEVHLERQFAHSVFLSACWYCQSTIGRETTSADPSIEL